MTWRSFFSLATLQNRHLLGAYAVAFLLQGGYFVWIGLEWLNAKPVAAKKTTGTNA